MLEGSIGGKEEAEGMRQAQKRIKQAGAARARL